MATYASFILLVWFTKCILIDRSNSKESMLKLANTAHLIRDEKDIVFPEGTRGNGMSGSLPFKKGAFRLAVEAQVRYHLVSFTAL
ncbi:unnamed protein product [Rodentolepis nana]|uniref:1-acylglycerol-3-phosphate O-acyltransferase n=1 Tax=Rodentolepis nana TaxID=102285 RepID=A0A0R3U0S9_RODNA|nr:unnamed protein product [Rodentolepis nana]